MRVIVVRHYKTLINVANQIMGWGDAPRAKNWQADVAYVDKILKKNDLRFAAVYTSFLERARQTGMYYARSRGIPLIYDAQALNEINYGSLFRKTKQWVKENIPEHKKDVDFVYPQGESFRQMQARSVEYLQSLTRKYQGETILVVVHAGVIRGFISYFLNLPYTENLSRKISHRYIGDFVFEDSGCAHYDELGRPSGFVQQNIVSIPWEASQDGPIGEDKKPASATE